VRITYGQTEILLDAHPNGDKVILAEGIREVPRSKLNTLRTGDADLRF